MNKEIRRKIYYNKAGERYFIYNNTRHYLYNIDHNSGLDITMFTNQGYYGIIQVIDIVFDPDERVVLRMAKP